MRTTRFVTVDVFTDRRFGGNPLAVFPDAGGLSDADMQSLAAEFNLSETSFVLPPDDHANTARVRIFTPRHELPFAGHPNVGTAYVLAEHHPGATNFRFEEGAGLVEVHLERDGGTVTGASVAAPAALTVESGPSIHQLAPCATLGTGDFLTHHPPTVAGVGLPFIIAEVSDDALSRAAPNEHASRTLAPGPSSVPNPSLLIYARDGNRVRTRMFAPLSGIPEDPATGSANAALTALLLSRTDREEHALTITQGVEMGRPSLLRATARRTPDGIRATIAGGCVPVLSGQARLDPT